MKRQRFSFSLKSPGSYLLGLLTFLLLLTLSACGTTNSVRIYDNARVLNSSKVQHAASNLSNPVAVYTTNTFQGTEADFQRTAIQKLNGNPDMIVMAIDTNSRYIYIARGSHVPLSSNNINQAVNSFAMRFNNGDYTGASVAALNSMQSSISSSNQSRSSSSFNPLIPCLVLPLVLILGVMLFAASRRNRMRGMMAGNSLWGARRNPQFNEGPYYGPNQGPNQGYGPYNQGYGPPNQGGMNPWAAGGLGAAAGGLAGYELGKRSGERDADGNYDDNSNFGGGGGNFGGNDPNGNNFGGGSNFGGDDPGGGGNFGGGFGGSNFFGGGGNFGGGNDDFGGGGSFGSGSGDDSGGGGNF